MHCNYLMSLLPIEKVLQANLDIELNPGFPELFQKIKAQNPDNKIIIASDSNTEFISIILNKHNLNHYIDEIHTNGAVYNSDKTQLQIITYEKFYSCPRAEKCDKCNPLHMCKGDISRRMIQKYENCDKVLFAGDGHNDYCGMCTISKISENSGGNLQAAKLARQGFSLERKLKKSENLDFPDLWWDNGFDLISYLEKEKKWL